MTEYRLRLPWTAVPKGLSANHRVNYMAKARAVREARTAVGLLIALQQFTPEPWPTLAPRVTVGLDYWPRDRRKRDADNTVPLYKACVDAMTSAGVIEDDHDDIVTRTFPRIHAADGDPRFELWLTTDTEGDRP